MRQQGIVLYFTIRSGVCWLLIRHFEIGMVTSLFKISTGRLFTKKYVKPCFFSHSIPIRYQNSAKYCSDPVVPPNSAEPIRLQMKNHVTTMIFLSVDPRVKSGEYNSIINLSLPTMTTYIRIQVSNHSTDYFSIRNIKIVVAYSPPNVIMKNFNSPLRWCSTISQTNLDTCSIN